MDYPKAEMKLSSSASAQNIFLTYVCTINEVKPDGKLNNDSRHTNLSIIDREIEVANQKDDHIKVERSKALHELVEVHANDDGVIVKKVPNTSSSPPPYPTTSEDTDSTEIEDAKYLGNDNPNMLKLTRMKWLSEGREGSPDSRSPSLSSVSSSTSSQGSRESQTNLRQHKSFANKYLSTILRLDKEHNLFGLSNIAIVGSKTSKKSCKKDEKAVFHQTAIVQICCGRTCCRHMSNTNLPSSLKCGGCRGCCSSPCDYTCSHSGPPCDLEPLPCPSVGSCLSPKCLLDCNNSCFGVKMTVRRKPKYDPTYVELTPRSSCVFAKPIAARSCHHMPQCLPPSSCFPYLMPCYWPARAGAPCSNPTKCFHNPPCRPPRRPKSVIPIAEKCPPICDANGKCSMLMCPVNIPGIQKEIEARFGNNARASK